MNKNGVHSFQAFLLLTVLFCMLGPVGAQSAGSPPPEVLAYADLVFYNGKILTADEQFTIVQAVAIRDGKFLARGDDRRILAMAGPQTRRVDLEGRSVIPGFIDTHLHSAWIVNPPRATGGTARRPALPQLNFDTLENALESLRARVAAAQPGEVIALGGPSNPVVNHELNVTLLDEIAPENMLWIEASNDQIVANSLVLAKVPEGIPGVITDAQGRRTGHLRGAAAGIPTYEREPWPDVELLLDPH